LYPNALLLRRKDKDLDKILIVIFLKKIQRGKGVVGHFWKFCAGK
jgi:hypothetical protein